MINISDANLIQTLGLQNLKETDLKKILSDIGDVIYESIIMRAIKSMSEENKQAFEQLLSENPTHEVLGEFIYNNVPNIDKIAEEEIVNFKKIALKTAGVTV
jgi:succinate dehydrogenase flavin-adding protein (antitoxin of CptAB toxin-antitoxin module)